MAALRIISYNVKGFGSGFNREDPVKVAAAYDRIRADVERLRPQVLCLNEVARFSLAGRGDSLEALAEDLGDLKVHFAHATPGYESFGNAVLVAPEVEVLGSSSTHLDGGSVVHTKDGREKQIVRGALGVRLRLPAHFGSIASFAIVVTHLDHISDAERRRQVASLCAALPEELSGGLPHLLVGDLNAMKRSDYGPSEWQALEERNLRMGWAPPADSEALRALEAAGYDDLLQRSLRPDGEPLAGASAVQKMTAPVESPNTRIDYAYACPALTKLQEEGRRGETLLMRASVDSEASGSDHFPLCIELPRPC